MCKIKNSRIFKTSVCFILCALFCVQSFCAVTVFGIDIEEKLEEWMTAGNTQMDTFLDFYAEWNYYGLTREQAMTVMFNKFLTENPEMVAVMGNSLLKTFDTYGGYYPGTSTQEIFSNAYLGYGIIMEGKVLTDGYQYGVIIEQVLNNSPAMKAGLEAGDEIVKIEETNVEDFGMIAVSRLLSTYEDEVTITVKRDGKDITVTMGKATVSVPSVSFFTNEETSTVLIKITDFLDNYMLYDVYDIYYFLEEYKYDNLVIDLRDNPGGNLLLMVETLNIFIPDKGEIIYSEKYSNGELESAFSSGDGLAFDKICVLVNGATASAAEIFALSIQEIAGALIIGEKTYGKGIGQFYTMMKNGDTIAVTACELISPNGNSYNGEGVFADITLPPEYITVEIKPLSPLNFVNCRNIKEGAENNAILALNQRLARIGYISPDDVTNKCSEKTITAVEIFQKYYELPVGISKIDYNFLEYLDYYAARGVTKYQERDVQLECAEAYLYENEEAARAYAEDLTGEKKTGQE